MSIEALLVFALFVLVPLVERLLREVQQRNQRAGGQAGPPPAQRRLPPPSAPVPSPVALPSPAALPSPSEAITETMVARRARPPDTTRPPVRTMTQRVKHAPAAARLALRDRFALRRAVVQMTILGPCRAVHSHDWPERGGLE